MREPPIFVNKKFICEDGHVSIVTVLEHTTYVPCSYNLITTDKDVKVCYKQAFVLIGEEKKDFVELETD